MPFLSHAPMELMNCTVHVRGWRGGVGAHAESDHLARGGADRAPPKGEPAHLVYGWRLRTARKGELDFVAGAAEVAKAVGVP
jgi:hypothetical protein